ncbi:hypothetical protein CBOM_03013 [Ceraceosorus bombacis]|uniref:Uncharacterized protein n=1 Tax=Ceraceosorus bombacis TaxID=401625 RepID=A0A0P1BKG2_9BASI|nr:hypothetical protein CBOM_03013 [Ceraceosorus bombacis]
MALKTALHLRGRSSNDIHGSVLPTDHRTSPPVSPAPSGTNTPSRSQSLSRGAVDADEPDLTGRQPKRSSSFGRGLGLSALAGLSKATDSVQLPAFARRSGHGSNASDGLRTPPASSAQSNGFLSAHQAPPNGSVAAVGNPDPGHIAQFSLRLSELVNKAFQPIATTSPPAASLSAAVGAVAGSTRGAPLAPPLSAVTYDRRLLPLAARVQELAKLVTSELRYAAGIDDYLLRAVSRAALKALSLFVDRMDALLVSAARDVGASFVPLNAKDGAQPPAAMEYNLGLVALLWIVEDGLERCVEGDDRAGATHVLSFDPLPAFVAEILAPVRQRMERSILHIVNPLLANLKIGLIGSIAQAVPTPFDRTASYLSVGVGAATSTTTIHSPAPAKGGSAQGPIWAKDFEGRMEGARRLLLPRLEARCGLDGEGWYVSLAVQTIWKGLLRLTARPMPPPASLVDPSCSRPSVDDASKTRNPTPAQLTSALKVVAGVARGRKREDAVASSGRATPAAMLDAAHESPPLKPASSPPHASKSLYEQGAGSPLAPPQTVCARASALQAADFVAFERCMQGYAQGFAPTAPGPRLPPTSAPKADIVALEDDDADSEGDDSDADELARAALAEALQAIRSCAVVAAHLDSHPLAVLNVLRTARSCQAGEAQPSTSSGISTPTSASTAPAEVCRALKAIPPLLLLHLVYARMPRSSVFDNGQRGVNDEAIPRIPSPPELFGLSWTDYSKALGGFASGETWASACASGWSDGIEGAWKACSTKVAQLEAALRQAQSELTKSQINANAPENMAQPTSPGLRQGLPEAAQRTKNAEPASSHMSAASTPALSRQSSVAEHSDHSVDTPDSMTLSMSALDAQQGRGEPLQQPGDASAGVAPGFSHLTSVISAPGMATGAKGPRWNLLKRSQLGKTGRDAAGTAVNGSSSPSPEQSPPFGPAGDGSATTTSSAAHGEGNARRTPFWRTSSTGHQAGLHLGANQPHENGTTGKAHAPTAFRIPGLSSASRSHSPRGKVDGATSPGLMTELSLEALDSDSRRVSGDHLYPATQKAQESIAHLGAEKAAVQTELASLDLLARTAEFVSRSKAALTQGVADVALTIGTPALDSQVASAPSVSTAPVDPRLSKLRFAEQ